MVCGALSVYSAAITAEGRDVITGLGLKSLLITAEALMAVSQQTAKQLEASLSVRFLYSIQLCDSGGCHISRKT